MCDVILAGLHLNGFQPYKDDTSGHQSIKQEEELAKAYPNKQLDIRQYMQRTCMHVKVAWIVNLRFLFQLRYSQLASQPLYNQKSYAYSQLYSYLATQLHSNTQCKLTLLMTLHLDSHRFLQQPIQPRNINLAICMVSFTLGKLLRQ